MTQTIANWVLLCGMLVPFLAMAQEEDPTETRTGNDEAIHDELRALRVALVEALKKGDVDGQLSHVHNNVVATWQNNRVVRGHDGLRNFITEMNAANQSVFRGYKVEPEADELTILYGGDTGIVFGKSVPQYHYLGMDFELENRWTATLVKQDGSWKIAAYHVSGNLVDNPVLNAAKQAVYWTGGVCLVVGLVVGSVGSALLRRGKHPPA